MRNADGPTGGRRTTWLSRREAVGQTALPLAPPPEGPSLPVRTTVPFSGRSAQSRHHSHRAAERVRGKDGTRGARYLDLLKQAGPKSDHQAAEALHVPLSTVNGIRNRRWIRPLIEEVGETTSPNGCPCSTWGLRSQKEL